MRPSGLGEFITALAESSTKDDTPDVVRINAVTQEPIKRHKCSHRYSYEPFEVFHTGSLITHEIVLIHLYGQDPKRYNKAMHAVTGDHRQMNIEFTIESAPSTAVLKLQCFVASHHAERLAERIRELTHAGYFDRHPKAIDKLAQCCDVLLVDTQLVKCRQTLPRLMYQHYETRTGCTADLDEILNAVDTDKAMTP